jgi:hypothetical protein
MQGVMRSKSLALVVLTACNLAACNSVPEPAARSEMTKPVKADDGPATNCASRAAFDIIRDKIFDAAIGKVEASEARKLNSLRSIIAGRMEAPIVNSHDPGLERTECAGKVVFGLPPNTQKAFNGADALTADITYSVQPAADKSGLVVEAFGTEPLIDSLVAGAKLKRIVPVRVPPPPRPIEGIFDPPPRSEPSLREFGAPIEPEPSAVKPSFGCNGRLNRVENAICNNFGLAEQDQTMAAAYRDAKERTPVAARAGLEGLRQKYLGRRNRCADDNCIAATYDAWTSALNDWAP